MIALVPHPQMPAAGVRGVHAAAARTSHGMLALRYRIEGDLERLRIPPPRTPAPGERLWHHLCCEVFVGPGSGSAYREFNFSPSGEWAAYAFERYREGAPLAVPDPGIALWREDGALELSASVAVEPGRLRVGLCAVIEEGDGTLSPILSYWALRHPAPRPDFHHAAGFALEVA